MRSNTRKIGILLVLSLLLSLLAGSMAYGAEMSKSELDEIKAFILERYVDPLSPEELQGDTPEALFENLDVHSVYYSPQAFQSLLEQLGGSFVGIGAYVQEDEGKIIIAEPIANSPAERAGLLPGDEVLEVNGTLLKGMTVDEAVSLIKGPEGTQVTLKIHRPLTDETLMIDIIREEILMETVYAEEIDGIGYIQIISFYEHTYEEFFNAVSRLYDQGIRSLVVDIRNNGGGVLDSVLGISQLLVPKGPILHIQYNAFEVTYLSQLSRPLFKDIVVLVNENSASASEILAAAMQDTRAATIIGSTTYGKGSVQRIHSLYSGGGFKLTEARYLSPNRTVIDGVGVKPDIEVDRFPEKLDIENLLPLNLETELSLKAQGEEVKALQQRLKALDYGSVSLTGEFDQNTLNALKQFSQATEISFDEEQVSLPLKLALQGAFLEEALSRENDNQLNYAIDYLKGGHRAAVN